MFPVTTLVYKQHQIRVFKDTDGFAYVPTVDVAEIARGSKVYRLLPHSNTDGNELIDQSVFNMENFKDFAVLCTKLDMTHFGNWIFNDALEDIKIAVGNIGSSLKPNEIACFEYGGRNITGYKAEDTIYIDAKQLYFKGNKTKFIKLYIKTHRKTICIAGHINVDVIDLAKVSIVGNLYGLIPGNYGGWILQKLIPRAQEVFCKDVAASAEPNKAAAAEPRKNEPKAKPKATPAEPKAVPTKPKATPAEPTGHMLAFVELAEHKFVLYIDMLTDKLLYNKYKQFIVKTWSFDSFKSAKDAQMHIMMMLAIRDKIDLASIGGLNAIHADASEIIEIADFVYEMQLKR